MQKRRQKGKEGKGVKSTPEVEVAMGQMVVIEDTSNTIGTNPQGRIVETEKTTGDLRGPPKPKTLGPCFQYGAYGHIARFCNVPRRPYPFTQPVVSSAEEWPPAASSVECFLCCDGVDGNIAMSKICVNEAKPIHHATIKEGVDGAPYW